MPVFTAPMFTFSFFVAVLHSHRLVFLLPSIIWMGWTQRCFFHVGVKEIRAFEVCQALAEGKTLVLMRPLGLSEKEKTHCGEREWEGCFETAHIGVAWWHVCIVSDKQFNNKLQFRGRYIERKYYTTSKTKTSLKPLISSWLKNIVCRVSPGAKQVDVTENT